MSKMKGIRSVSNEKDLNDQLVEARKALVVIHFWAEWAEQCKQMNDVFEELAKQHQDVIFLTIEAEELPEVSQKYEIEAVPSFIFFKNKQKIGRLNGANAPELTRLVKEHISTIAPASGLVEDAKTDLNDRLKSLINSDDCVLFMKGNAEQPRCGFSRQMISILEEHKCKYSTFDILQDEAVRQGLKEYSSWPTYPQLYVKGELIGGLDIIKEMVNENELKDVIPCQPDEDSKEKLKQRIVGIINQSHVVLFMKGQPALPRCGFSRQIVAILNETEVPYSHFDVLSDEAIRQGVKQFSDWPTYPQLYAGGELLGGLDIVKEMVSAGELRDALQPPPSTAAK